MARSLLVVPASPWAGLASTCLGLVRALDRRGVRVAFVKPVAQPRDNGAADHSAALVAAVSALRPPDPLPAAEVEQELSGGGLDAVLEKIVAAWQPVYGQSEVVVIEAVSPGPARFYAAEFNQALAQALDADVVLAGRWPPAASARPAGAGDGPAGAAGSADGPAGDAAAH
ncbi:MAG TPA: AAA family ATPase, partial [Streptosporangiaceae bacterium]|nr:AAA family ATPase [Streptosporangiaceae bacterium]